MSDGMRIDAIGGVKNDKYLEKMSDGFAQPKVKINSAFEEYRKNLQDILNWVNIVMQCKVCYSYVPRQFKKFN